MVLDVRTREQDADLVLGLSNAFEARWLTIMPDAQLRYSLNQVKQAGRRYSHGFVDSNQIRETIRIIQNWRDCHTLPMRYFYDSLSEVAGLWPKGAITVAQRPKRMESIISKLANNPAMSLTRMQDVAGCRAISQGNVNLQTFVEACQYHWRDHELAGTYDYIAKPKSDGYRSLHLVYRYQSDNPSFNGRFVEVQIRSHLQHVWATAVEMIDLFEKQRLKFGQGDETWKRFFALMGSVVAKLEKLPLVPDTPEDDVELAKELKIYADHLQVAARMHNYRVLVNQIPNAPSPTMSGFSGVSGYSGSQTPEYFLLQLSDDSKQISVKGYAVNDVFRGIDEFKSAENNKRRVVFVAARSLAELKEAYPSWIIDTRRFLDLLKFALTRAT